MSRPDGRIVPVILSGGSGTRLWPLSREQLPKQLLALVGNDRTMLQDTVVRVRDVPAIQSPVIVCNEEHRFLIADQLAEMGVADARILLEPIGRNTAPAVALAAEVLLSQTESTEDPLLLVLPADHVIADAAALRAAVKVAAPFANAGKLVTFGVLPTSPETGYGYIQLGAALGAQAGGAFAIAGFREKPARAQAEAFLARHPEYKTQPVTADELPVGVVANADGHVRTIPPMLAEQGGLDGFFVARFTHAG